MKLQVPSLPGCPTRLMHLIRVNVKKIKKKREVSVLNNASMPFFIGFKKIKCSIIRSVKYE
jgi:hypothetical protein